jgi:hypothetical protein
VYFQNSTIRVPLEKDHFQSDQLVVVVLALPETSRAMPCPVDSCTSFLKNHSIFASVLAKWRRILLVW